MCIGILLEYWHDIYKKNNTNGIFLIILQIHVQKVTSEFGLNLKLAIMRTSITDINSNINNS